MFKTLKLYFDFADEVNRKKLYTAMLLGVLKAIFATLRIPAIAIILQGILNDDMSKIKEYHFSDSDFNIKCNNPSVSKNYLLSVDCIYQDGPLSRHFCHRCPASWQCRRTSSFSQL